VADGILAAVVEVAEDTGATDTAVIALAERSILAMGREEWSEAEVLVERARSLRHAAHLEDYVANVLLYAAAARVGHPPLVPRDRRATVPVARR
jgi:hypothetical protein